ncbi:MAG: hypothetical protein M3N41_11775 [Acidobacteriota bacterium]|nr:hypothetical protein [Acidobacteriota bacterium]
MILVLSTQAALLGQEKAVSVPFVGCKSDGQIGPMEAPIGTRVAVPISPKAAQALAYYSTGPGSGVLAPRGWHCFGLYGSSGSVLFVGPRPTDTANLHSSGPAIVISHTNGDGSGGYEVAEIMARVFPAYRDFADALAKEYLATSFTFGPYPKDLLIYKSKEWVEYKTPPYSEGLGTRSLEKNSSAIEGVAMLVGQRHDLVFLSVRLPPEWNGLTSVIVRQVERDAERSDYH